MNQALTPPFTVTIAPSGRQFAIEGGSTVLEAALQAGLSLPSSCRNGTCRSCLCQLISGKIHYRIEWPGVSADEKKEGLVLPCVAFADSDLDLFIPLATQTTRLTNGDFQP